MSSTRCALWCGVCRDYRPAFAEVETRFPGLRFASVDVEDDAAPVDPVQIDDFPTPLIAAGAEPRFFGALMPHAGTLERVVRERAPAADAVLPSAAGQPRLDGSTLAPQTIRQIFSSRCGR